MNARPVLVPVVEGYGEVEAFPKLLSRLLRQARVYDLHVGQAHRRHRSELVNEDKLRRIIEVARSEPGCQGIFVLFDADDDCPKELREKVEPWAVDAARGVPCRLTVPNREFEAWFLAAMESLRGHKGISANATFDAEPEAPRNAKKELERRMAARVYKERTDQVVLAERFDLAAAHRRSRSFRRMVKVFGEVLVAMGRDLPHWPPADWT